MKIPESIRKFISPYTYGWIATAAIILCAISGALLVVPYDIVTPYFSITKFLTLNPFAAFIRNVHYWSAQLFLILTLLHIFDHFRVGTETRVRKKGIWFRLTISILIALYVMLSGFILKADGDSMQAHRIMSSLIQSLPLVGEMLAQTFIGSENNFQVIYIQHVSTATIILFVVIFEHARSLKVNLSVFLFTTLFLVVLSFFFRAPLSDLQGSVMKGPWYFVGLQEILHWVSNPLYVMLGLLLLLILVYLIPFVKSRFAKIIKLLLLVIMLMYSVLSVTGYFFRGAMWEWQWPWQKGSIVKTLNFSGNEFFSSSDTLSLVLVQGKAEGCMSCHKEMQGFSESHKPEFIGCYSCHGGNPYTLNKEAAHSNMRLIPGNLSDAEISCGSAGCHAAVVHRVNNSLMTSLSGIISVDKWIFGETQNLDEYSHVNDIRFSAADKHLRNLCAGCHLGNEKVKAGPAAWLERGGGCLACHLTYDKNALASLNAGSGKNKKEDILPQYHPAIDLNITNDKCISCHSRSGRISMNYEGWHETKLNQEEVEGDSNFKTLPDKRVFVKMPDDVHNRIGMFCIDCHGSYELMGDGIKYAHKESAVKVQCSDCHSLQPTHVKLLKDTDHESQLIAWLRKYQSEGTRVLITQKGNLPLVNTFVENSSNRPALIRKSGVGTLYMKAPAKACSEGNVHERLSCEACHTAWVPQCIGCHTSYDRGSNGFDMIKNKETKGTWVEYSTQGLPELPVLGVSFADNSEGKGIIGTFSPGMIMTLDKGSFSSGEKTSFHRLYAPTAAHTTARKGRSCKSCHNSSLALGYGRGALTYNNRGKWLFDSEYENSKYDGLPEDAWIGFLKVRSDQSVTRKNRRPFSLEEQKRVLLVGSCLSCHKETSLVAKQMLVDFQGVIKKRSNKCIMPTW